MMMLGQFRVVLVGFGGIRSVWGGTGWYFLVLGQYGAVLVGTWWYLVSIGWYWLKYDGTGSVKGGVFGGNRSVCNGHQSNLPFRKLENRKNRKRQRYPIRCSCQNFLFQDQRQCDDVDRSVQGLEHRCLLSWPQVPPQHQHHQHHHHQHRH